MSVQLAQSAVHSAEQTLFFTLLQLVVILVTARLAGHAARRLGHPRVIGEIVAGILLGPSLFGALAPDAFRYVFQSIDAQPLSIISQLGLIMLMFQIGLDFDFAHLRDSRNRRAVAFVAALSIVLPFGLGYAFGHFSAPYLAPGMNPVGYALFMATALSITAVPVLGRIMMEFDLNRTPLGAVTVSAAAVNDVVGWILLGVISTLVMADFSLAEVALKLLWLALYLLVSWFVIKLLLRRLVAHFRKEPQLLSQDLMAILLVVIFGSAMFTSEIGIFAIFGGFMMGVLLHDHPEFVTAWKAKVADLVTVLFLPIFFTYTGLRTNVHGLDSLALWLWCATMASFAVLGKFGGAWIGARLAGLSCYEARNVAIMMNTRGLMALIVINIGLDLGVIPKPVFTMLVLMAILSTLMAAPGLRAWLPRIGHAIPANRDA